MTAVCELGAGGGEGDPVTPVPVTGGTSEQPAGLHLLEGPWAPGRDGGRALGLIGSQAV